MADKTLTQGQQLAATDKVLLKEISAGVYALAQLAVLSVGDEPVSALNPLPVTGGAAGDMTVPTPDSAANILMRDVVGSKLDSNIGDSLYGVLQNILTILARPVADAPDNGTFAAVIGNKEDAADETADTASIIALLRQVLEEIDEANEEIEEVEEHFHNIERWWGAAAVPDETNAIDANVNRDFQAASGNNTWGTAIPILGTADDPTPSGQLIFDAHRVLFTDLDDDTTLWRFRIIYGYGTSGDAITAGQWTEIPTITTATPGNRAGGVAVDIKMIILPVGIKMWAQSWNDTNSEELDFQYGVHAYPAPSAPTPP